MDEVVKTAATESGWVAALLVLLVLSGFGVLGYIVRQLWIDHRELQRFVRSELVDLVSKNTTAYSRLGDLLDERPCLRDREERAAERIRQSHILPDPDAPIARTLKPAGTQ